MKHLKLESKLSLEGNVLKWESFRGVKFDVAIFEPPEFLDAIKKEKWIRSRCKEFANAFDNSIADYLRLYAKERKVDAVDN
ncbi:hypothetical protein ES703_62274 [subsurface metagenome]